MAQEQQAAFKDSTDLTNWTKWFLYVQVVMAVIATISNMLEYQLISGFQNEIYASQEQVIVTAEANDARQGVVRLIQFIVFVVSGILILQWIYRANYNARHLGASGMKFTPAWSIGWYFIPIASLWKPYQAMKEIWKASSNPQDWNTSIGSSLLPWWWFFWIVVGPLEQVSFRLSMEAEEIGEIIFANVVTQLCDIASIPLFLIFLAIVNRVHEMQMSYVKTKQNIGLGFN